eukprot:1925589-Prymnesium_polylepis.1
MPASQAAHRPTAAPKSSRSPGRSSPFRLSALLVPWRMMDRLQCPAGSSQGALRGCRRRRAERQRRWRSAVPHRPPCRWATCRASEGSRAVPCPLLIWVEAPCTYLRSTHWCAARRTRQTDGELHHDIGACRL